MALDSIRNQQNKADITAALVSKGMSAKKASKATEVLIVAANHGYFTDAQTKVLEKNPAMVEVLRDVIGEGADNKTAGSVNIRNTQHDLGRKGIRVADDGTLNSDDLNAFTEKAVEKMSQSGLSTDLNETQYDVSTEGRNTVTVDDTNVTLDTIEFVNDNGTVKVKVDDTVSVDAGDVSYRSEGLAEVVAETLYMGVDAKSTQDIVNMFKGTTLKEATLFMSDVKLAFKYGTRHFDKSNLSKLTSITEDQADRAYILGEAYANAQTEAKQTAINEKVAEAEASAETDAEGNVIPKIKQGKIIFEEGTDALKNLPPRQRISIEVGLALLAEISPIEFHIFQTTKDSNGRYSYVMKNGKKMGANGFYRVGTNQIWIDINAGDFGEGTMLWTVAHEISHYIKHWSPAKWKVMADFIVEQYGKAGKPVDAMIEREAAIIRKREENAEKVAKEKGEKYTPKTETEIEDEAFEEFVCNALIRMLDDGSIVENMAELKKVDKSLWQKIKDVIKDLLAKWGLILDEYKDLSADREAARHLDKMNDTFKKLQQLYQDAFVDANYVASMVSSVESQNNKSHVKESVREDFYTQLDKWDKTTTGFSFVLGRTSEVLKQANIPDRQIRWDASKIKTLLNKHNGMTIETIRKIPELLENPIIVIDSKQNEDSRIAMGDLYDSNGKIITVVLLLTPTSRKGNQLDIIKVSSAQGRGHIESLFHNDDGSAVKVRYKDEKRIQNWLNVNRLQLPLHSPNLDSNNSIRNSHEKVNLKNQENETGPKIKTQERTSDFSPNLRYQERDYSYNALISKPDMKLTNIDNVVKYKPTKTLRKAAVEKALQNAKVVGNINDKGNISVFVKDVETDIVLSKKSLEHGLDRRFSDNLPATLKAGEILKNAIKINEITPKVNTADNAYVLIGAAKNKNREISIVRFVVNSFSYEVSSIDILYALTTKKESAVLNAPPLANNDSLRITDSNISISDLLDYVNKYFPDILPEEVLKHYGYSERPEGVLGKDALFQERNLDSNRYLLATALESAAKNETELKWLKEYKESVSQIDALEKHLNEVNARAKKLHSSKDERDRAEYKRLRDEATKTANRIGIHDKKLLRLEANESLKKLIGRERAKAYSKAKKEGQEIRKRATERRNISAIKNKIKRFKEKMESTLLRPTDMAVIAQLVILDTVVQGIYIKRFPYKNKHLFPFIILYRTRTAVVSNDYGCFL